MIKVMYSNNQCAVIDGEGTSDWFTVKSGVKQRCNMSGFLVIMVIDWIMSKTTKDNKFGIRWNFTSKLDDLDYADDIALLSSSKDHIQRKSEILDTISRSTGLIINSAKTKVIRMNNTNEHTITINGTDIEEVDTFIYLGATVSKEGGTDREKRRRLGHARVAYNKLRKIWSSSQFSRKTKLKIFKSNVISVLLYGSETWKMNKGDEKLLDTFLHKCLRKIMMIFWPLKMANDRVRELAELDKISTVIKVRRWKWIGHVLRLQPESNARTALTWTTEGRRKQGRPKETWRRTVERERKHLGFRSWNDAATRARDRTEWRGLINGPILHRERRN